MEQDPGGPSVCWARSRPTVWPFWCSRCLKKTRALEALEVFFFPPSIPLKTSRTHTISSMVTIGSRNQHSWVGFWKESRGISKHLIFLHWFFSWVLFVERMERSFLWEPTERFFFSASLGLLRSVFLVIMERGKKKRSLLLHPLVLKTMNKAFESAKKNICLFLCFILPLCSGHRTICMKVW